MGAFCDRCLKEENEENDEDNNSLEKINISPKNYINKKELRYQFDSSDKILKSNKKENLKKKNSKSKEEDDIMKNTKSSKNINSRRNLINFEEDLDDIEDILPKNKKDFINPPMNSININMSKEKDENFPDSNKIKTNPKNKSVIPFRRRKNKSSTVRQNKFLFAKIFNKEMFAPINQENLIWEQKGLPENNYYMRGKLLGKGAFGQVYESKNPLFNSKVAMKIIKKNKYDLVDINENEYIKSEINILKKLSHPNIVRIYEFYESDNYFYLINEYCKDGPLFDYLQKNILSESQLCVIFYQVFSGLIYLHENHILHGDLKPENIILSSIEKNLETNEDYAWVKIIDFGTAKIFKNMIIKGEDIQGTLYYIAPEVFSYTIDAYDEKSDIWSIGVILFKALTKRYPFIGKNEDHTIYLISNEQEDYDKKNPLLIKYSKELQNLVELLLKKKPIERPSAKEALNHEWFKKFNGRRLFNNFQKEEMIPFINNLFNFSFSKIHQLVIAFLVHNLPETESSQKILKLYRYFNTSGNCELSKEELKKGLKEFKKVDEIENNIDKIFKELDGDNNGSIEYEEFLRACIDKNEILNDKYLSYAFKFLDKQNRKFLSPEQIISAFFSNNNESKNIVNKILDNNESVKDGLISFEDFKSIIYSLDKMK